MPPRVDQCVQSLMDDPNFKPKEGKTKEESAWALCNWLDQQGKLKATNDGVKVTMAEAGKLLTGPFRVVLPITGARRQIVEKAEGGEEVQLWLHIEASGPERDSDGDRFSEAGLAKMVEYAEKNPGLNLLDGHHRDLLAAILGDIYNPYLTEEKHFAFDALLNSENPFATQLFNDVLAGKRHGASIAGAVHDAEIEEYGDGEFGQIFNDVELLEVSRTSWPSYRDSFITLLANKVGKLPVAEFEAVMKRRGDLEKLKTGGGDEMLVKTADDGTEEWEENEAGDLIVKITSPHGWDEKFGVSDTSWADVEDRTKPCQYALVKQNEDGSFSPSKSGYPHHMPACDTINRGGTIAAAGRLVQALKSKVPALETPPIVSLVAEKIGNKEFLLYKQESAFTNEELKYAANHIIRHYRQDMDEEPPENLVDVAKTYGDEKDEIVDLIKGLVQMIKVAPTMEGTTMTDKNVVETPAEEQEPTEQTETVTDTVVQEETEPVDKQEVEDEEVISEPVPAEEETISTLGKVVDARLLASKFGELIFAMQEMVMEAVEGSDLESALSVLNDFGMMSKDVLSKLIVAQQAESVALSFLAPIESRVELATGALSKSRVQRIDKAIEHAVADLLSLRGIIKSDDDTVVAPVETVETKVETKSEHMIEFEKRLEAVEQQSKDDVDTLAKALATPKREQPAPINEEVVVELTPEEERFTLMRRFGKSAKLE